MIVLTVIATIGVTALQAPISSNLAKGNAMNDSEYKSFVAHRAQFDSLPGPRQQLLDEVEYVYGLEDISCYYDTFHLVKVDLIVKVDEVLSPQTRHSNAGSRAFGIIITSDLHYRNGRAMIAS